ncbi:hypothetical protein M413DRAFT_27801 [Hebeloma cylindrosporum]|uniref:F-box domain-containing protein n=1 Tax=Hebeloma cylindrosporum TaxID=76867 RepID=A0A0C2YK84_HEBCY|nr:hypothetical protein M413DRAFT_27801 [Hebeloma cylindrosporum h7]
MELDPILTALLRNNELPSEGIFQETTRLRSQADDDLLDIDMEVQHLMAKREQGQRSLGIYNTILSPARRLPPDILRDIFSHCIEPLWRSVALSSPRIWTRLHIPIPGDHRLSPSYELTSVPAVKNWLDRSGSLPLSLSISHPSVYLKNGTQSQHTINELGDDGDEDLLFQIIQPFAPRWRYLTLSVPLNIYQKLETKIPFHSLSMLKGFTGNVYPQGAASASIPLNIIEVPSLEMLSINCPHLTLNLGHQQTSWNRFTDLSFISPVTDTDLLEMLKQCHNLVTLNVNMQVPWIRLDGVGPNLKMVLLPHLESLKLLETGSTSLAISAINAPALKLLHYRCPHRYEGFGADTLPILSKPDSLVWLIANAVASLETLSIEPRSLRSEHVLECLRLAVHVKELILGDKPFNWDPEADICRDPDFFDLDAFTVPCSEYESPSSSTSFQHEILLPNLESLEANDGYILSDENVRRVLTSRIEAARRAMTSPLRRVKIQFERQKEEDIIPEIVALARDAGVAIELDLVYRPPRSPNLGPLSPSFLLPGHVG